jgi:hypothetical protein
VLQPWSACSVHFLIEDRGKEFLLLPLRLVNKPAGLEVLWGRGLAGRLDWLWRVGWLGGLDGLVA